MNKILVGLSTGESIRKAEFLPHFMGLDKPDGTIILTVHGQSPAQARNIIASKALELDCTHIMFLDDDMVPPVDTMTKLLAHDKDIVSALYLMRTFPHQAAAFDRVYDSGKCKVLSLNPDKNGLVRVVNAGLGAVLIKTEVFKKLEKPWVRLGEIDKDGWCDDIGFFNRCREAGFEMFCDLNAPVGHITSCAIWPTYSNGQWNTQYRHQEGNIEFPQQLLTDEVVSKQEKDETLLMSV